jgi:hypothetical protein
MFMCSLTAGLQLLIEACLHNTLEIALWLLLMEEHTVWAHFLEDVYEKIEYFLALDSPASGA